MGVSEADHNGIFKDYLTREQVADLLGKSVPTLDRWHRLGEGPVRTKIGKTVLYRVPSLKAWMLAQEEAVTEGAA